MQLVPSSRDSATQNFREAREKGEGIRDLSARILERSLKLRQAYMYVSVAKLFVLVQLVIRHYTVLVIRSCGSFRPNHQ